jgi:hypothetical protein
MVSPGSRLSARAPTRACCQIVSIHMSEFYRGLAESKLISKMPAWEFARFVQLAKSGHAFMGAMVIEDCPPARNPPSWTRPSKNSSTSTSNAVGGTPATKMNVGVNWRSA